MYHAVGYSVGPPLPSGLHVLGRWLGLDRYNMLGYTDTADQSEIEQLFVAGAASVRAFSSACVLVCGTMRL